MGLLDPPHLILFPPHTQVCMCVLSCFVHVQLFVILWTVAQQAPLSMGFSRQEYWSGLRSNLRLLHLLCCKWILSHHNTREAPTPKAGGEFWEGALDWSQASLLLGDYELGWVIGHLWASLFLPEKWDVGITWEDWIKWIILAGVWGWSRWTLNPVSPSLNPHIATY